jgi:hypothetical protein
VDGETAGGGGDWVEDHLAGDTVFGAEGGDWVYVIGGGGVERRAVHLQVEISPTAHKH